MTTNQVLAGRARELAARTPNGSPDRRAFGCAAVALTTASSFTAARKVLEADCPDIVRAAALEALNTLTRSGRRRVTALADLLSPRERQLLTDRLAELREVEQLVREIPAQRPPETTRHS